MLTNIFITLVSVTVIFLAYMRIYYLRKTSTDPEFQKLARSREKLVMSLGLLVIFLNTIILFTTYGVPLKGV